MKSYLAGSIFFILSIQFIHAQTFPWNKPTTVTFSAGVKPYFQFNNVPNTAGTFQDSLGYTFGVTDVINGPDTGVYNNPNNVSKFTLIRPNASAPGQWSSLEFPNPSLSAMKSWIYSTATNYIQTNFPSVPLSNVSDQLMVASIIAAMRDRFLYNFTFNYCGSYSQCNQSPRPPQDVIIAGELNNFDAYNTGTYSGNWKMMSVIADAVNNIATYGNKIQCTETSQFLTFILNGYGIASRWWDVAAVSGGNVSPMHGTVEYYDRQLQKWVFVDLLYGIAGVIKTNQPVNSIVLSNTPQQALSLPEWIYAINNVVDYPILLTPRNQWSGSYGQWFSPYSSVAFYGSSAFGNTPANQVFINPNGSLTRYTSVKEP